MKARASMDVSDGLLIDLKRLLEANGRGGELWLDCVPLAQPSSDLDVILKQVTGGDDYQTLLFAPEGVEFTGFTRIGRLTEAAEFKVLLDNSPINLPETLGFEH